MVQRTKSVRNEIFEYFEKEGKKKGITREKVKRALQKSGVKILREMYDV